jgi:hypothetical protein
MYLAGVSVRRVEDITEALWGTRVSPSTVSDLNKNIYGTIEAWRNRPIEGEHPYVYLDGIVLKRCWAGEVRNVSLLVAIAVNGEGYREILGICEGAKEDKAGWSAFLKAACCRAATRSSPAWIAFSIAATSRTLVEGTWLKTAFGQPHAGVGDDQPWRYQCTMQRCHAASGKNSAAAPQGSRSPWRPSDLHCSP